MKSELKNILFRVDASPEIGAGHFMRCLALAQQLQDQGTIPIFLTKTNIRYLLDRAEYENIEIIQVNKTCNTIEDSLLVKEIAEQKGTHWVILDGYNFLSKEYQKIVIGNSRKVLCIDDLAENHFICDAVINQNIGAEKLKYSCEPHTKLFLGTRYLLVKREFRNLQNWQRPIHKKAKNILVTMGGSLGSSSDAMLKIVKAINSLQDSTLYVKIILETNFQYLSNIYSLISQSNSNFEILPFTPDMLSLMKWADLVITAAGSTVWELILTYAPMMILNIADNQRIVYKFLRHYNCAKMLGWVKNISTDEVARNIIELMDSKESRYQFSSECRILVKNEFDFFDPKLIFGRPNENFK